MSGIASNIIFRVKCAGHVHDGRFFLKEDDQLDENGESVFIGVVHVRRGDDDYDIKPAKILLRDLEIYADLNAQVKFNGN